MENANQSLSSSIKNRKREPERSSIGSAAGRNLTTWLTNDQISNRTKVLKLARKEINSDTIDKIILSPFINEFET